MSKIQSSLCGCCEGIEEVTPVNLSNLPGLSDLIYRVGTHGRFKTSMLDGLSKPGILQQLTTRQDADASIALIDAWAVVLDILTFYQERILNEGYLLTAKERLSLFELAKHLSYRAKPGVAASGYLAFTVDEAIGSPLEIKVNQGTQVQSIPRKDERPQLFETLAPLQAKARWNAIRPALTEPQLIRDSDDRLYLQGTDTQLKVGDRILIVGDEFETDNSNRPWYIRTVLAVLPNAEQQYTEVKWGAALNKKGETNTMPVLNQRVLVFRDIASFFGHNAADVANLSADAKANLGLAADATAWPNYDQEISNPIDLDRVYEKIVPGGWLAMEVLCCQELYRVNTVTKLSRAAFGFSGKVSSVALNTSDGLEDFNRRITNILVASEALPLAERPIFDSVSGGEILLDDLYEELEVGQVLIISGEEVGTQRPRPITAIPSSLNEPVIVSELIKIAAIGTTSDTGHTVITLGEALTKEYVRSTVKINANIAHATHGETRQDILGSGNGMQAFQRFPLKQPPLTYVSAATVSGTLSTLEVRVDDIRWQEVPTFYGRGSGERIFTTRQEDTGTTYVHFGDGITGARLPSGVENVRATYRTGIGTEGILRAKQLAMLMTPQLGLREVINPLTTTDADEAEGLESIRENAPLTVKTLDRVVSLTDYEDFTRTFAGIGKVRADLMWKGEDQIVHLTVAGASAAGNHISSDLADRLLDAIDGVRQTTHTVVVNNYSEKYFSVAFNIRVDADYLLDQVQEAVRQTLLDTYSFDQSSFAQAITPSEVIALVQSVPGVVYVDLDRLGGIAVFGRRRRRARNRPAYLPSRAARWYRGEIQPAEMLLIDENNIQISFLKS